MSGCFVKLLHPYHWNDVQEPLGFGLSSVSIQVRAKHPKIQAILRPTDTGSPSLAPRFSTGCHPVTEACSNSEAEKKKESPTHRVFTKPRELLRVSACLRDWRKSTCTGSPRLWTAACPPHLSWHEAPQAAWMASDGWKVGAKTRTNGMTMRCFVWGTS